MSWLGKHSGASSRSVSSGDCGRRSESAIRRLSGEAVEDRVLTGLIREFDKDRSTFELREIEEPGFSTHRFAYEPAFEEEILDACQNDQRVRVIAVKEPSEKQFSVVAIRQLDS